MNLQTIVEGKRFYMEARTLSQYQAGLTGYINKSGRPLEIVILGQKAPGVNVTARRKKA
jgi:hypothetical protein